MISISAFVFVVAVTAGVELGLTLFVLGVSARVGVALPGTLAPLGSAELLTASAVCWAVETALRVRSVPGLLIWHVPQLIARPVAAALLAAAMVSGEGLGVVLVAGLLATIAATMGHAGSVGWMGLLHLARTPRRTRLLGAIAQQTSMLALLVLSLDHPGAAALLVLLLAALSPQLHLASISGLVFGALTLRDLMRSLWRSDDSTHGSLPGMPSDAAAALWFSRHPWNLLAGWLVLVDGQPCFGSWGREATPLGPPEAIGVVRRPWGTRLQLDPATVVFVPDAGDPEPLLGWIPGSTTAL